MILILSTILLCLIGLYYINLQNEKHVKQFQYFAAIDSQIPQSYYKRAISLVKKLSQTHIY